MNKTFILSLLPAFIICTAACTGLNRDISPLFNITSGELKNNIASLPQDIQSGILKTPVRFLVLIYAVLKQPEEFTWLVDKHHSLGSTYAPPDLVNLKAYPVKLTKDTLQIRKPALNDYLAMVRAAEKEQIILTASSTYRSYSYQDYLFKYWVEKLGRAQAENESAEPGKSQHQLGLTIDFDPITDEFGSSPAYKWLKVHAWEFGFSLSYPEGYLKITGYKYEPWHWRYIGKPAAELCKSYFNNIQQYFLEFLYINKTFFMEKLKKE